MGPGDGRRGTRPARPGARAHRRVADPYQLQAAIAACHTTAPSYAATDWHEVVRLYRLLAQAHPNPVVDLNAAVAVGEADGPAPALALLDTVAPAARSYLWHAARGEMLERLGDRTAAMDAFTAAAASAPSAPESRHKARRAADL